MGHIIYIKCSLGNTALARFGFKHRVTAKWNEFSLAQRQHDVSNGPVIFFYHHNL